MIQFLNNRRLRKAGEFWCYAADRALNELRYEIASDKLKEMRKTERRRLEEYFNPCQKLTLDHDIKEMKRALFMGGRDLAEGRIRTLEVGPTCDGCGQTGIAYHRDGKTRILVCKPIKRAIDDLIFKQWHNYLEETKYSPRLAPFSPSLDSMIAGCPIESIECGRNLKMHLRMRFCWFD